MMGNMTVNVHALDHISATGFCATKQPPIDNNVTKSFLSVAVLHNCAFARILFVSKLINIGTQELP